MLFRIRHWGGPGTLKSVRSPALPGNPKRKLLTTTVPFWEHAAAISDIYYCVPVC